MGAQRSPVQAVVFDLGGTLLQEIPGSDGPLPDGPRIEATPGAREALRALHGRYTLAVATNARLSDERHVRKALAQVGLDPYLAAVVTAHDVGKGKPDPGFFHAVLERVGCPPAGSAMVGDGYGTDIVGAKEAGLRAIWFNPACSPGPLVHPIHDAEVPALGDLPSTLDRPFPPDLAAALAILREHAVPENIVRHSLAVAAVAHRLAWCLRAEGIPVDPLLAHRGGLLHDLDKLSVGDHTEHGVKAGQILRELGWPDLAGIAEEHVLGANPHTWEEKVVHYADKIVEADRVVGLAERVSGLSRRYVADRDRIARALPLLCALEEEIVGPLSAPREEVMAELRALDLRLPPFVAA